MVVKVLLRDTWIRGGTEMNFMYFWDGFQLIALEVSFFLDASWQIDGGSVQSAFIMLEFSFLRPHRNGNGQKNQNKIVHHIFARNLFTLPKFNIAPENRPSQKETSFPTTNFQGLC